MAAVKLSFPEDLRGERALLAAVIGMAVRDFTSSRISPAIWASAAEYLGGPIYKDHLELLSLPADILPAGLEDKIR